MSDDEEEGEPRTGQGKPGDGQDGQDKDCEKVLLNPSEWEDPPECKVISEMHKVSEDQVIEEEDPDLAEWMDHWRKRSKYKVVSEYHKDGAPFLGDAYSDLPEPPRPEVKDEDMKVPDQDRVVEDDDGTGSGSEDDVDHLIDTEPETVPRPGPRPEPKVVPEDKARPHLERKLDVGTIEFLAYTIIRALFPRRVKYSIREEGVIDMDIAIMDRDIIINTNELMFELPDLSIWKFVYTYKGKPVFEMGRGVKNRMKVFYGRAFRLLWDMWRSKKARQKARKRREKALDDDVPVVMLGRKRKGKKVRVKKGKGSGK